MKKALVVLSIIAVFAILGLSISTAPIFNSNTDISLGLKDLDDISPEVQAKIDHDVEEALKGVGEEEAAAQAGPIVVEETNIESQALLGSTATLGTVTVKIEPRGDGNYIVGYTNVSGSEPELTINTDVGVVGIAEGAFKNLKTLKRVNLAGSGIKSIGMSAFYGCAALDTVTFPETIEKVGGYAFINTPWLKTARSNANQSSLKNRLVIVNHILIDGIAAEGDVVVDYANGISSISPYAFSYNAKMTSLTITGISQVPYRLCSSATGLQTLVLNGTAKVASFSFFDCQELTSVEMTGVSVIDAAAFEACGKLETVTFGNVLTRVNRNAFMDCASIQTLAFPATLEAIETAAFMNCKSITTIDYNGSTTDGNAGHVSIGQGAFQNCKRLDARGLDANGTNAFITSNGVILDAGTGAYFNTKS